MAQKIASSISRRQFLKTAGATTLAAGAGPVVIIPSRAQPKTLRILIGENSWFPLNQLFENFARAWGERKDIRVIVDTAEPSYFSDLVALYAASQQGHDIIGLGPEKTALDDHVIDHREIYEECVRRYGSPPDFALRMMSSKPGGKLIKISYNHVPNLVIYRKDLWGAIGIKPDTWENVRLGGRKIKFLHDKPVGIPLGESTLRSILYSFGASVQDAQNQPTLKSKETLETLKFVKALYDETMTGKFIPSGRFFSRMFMHRVFMHRGEISLTMGPVDIVPQGVTMRRSMTEHLRLARTPLGPFRSLAFTIEPQFRIFKFAQNIDLASEFLVDLVVT